MIKIYDLAYEIDGDAIELEQGAGCGDVSRITLHPIHLRMLAEKTGLLAPSMNIDAGRTIARLSRQMRLLLDRINTLDDWLNQAAQRGHEDLAEETTYSFATWEMANEFCKELPGNAGVTPAALPGRSSSPKKPENGTGTENGTASEPARTGEAMPLFTEAHRT